jgi:SAM-dependent methyltransferase
MSDWTMDMWKYYDVTHRRHTVCNPMSLEKLDALLELCALPDGARAVDIACGKGEMLVRLAERSAIVGIGVDLSPYFVADAERLRHARVPDADLTFVCKDGADWAPDAPESLDLALCVGAEWVYGGLAATCRALRAMVRPGGLVVVGTPYWLESPPEEYLAAEGFAPDEFAADLHAGVATGEAEGLELLYSVVSSPDDWDRYEALQWYAADEFAREDPDDPDLDEIRRRVAKAREIYLRWGRDHCNWALHLFRRTDAATRR